MANSSTECPGFGIRTQSNSVSSGTDETLVKSAASSEATISSLLCKKTVLSPSPPPPPPPPLPPLVTALDRVPPKPQKDIYAWLRALILSIGGTLFGYDTGTTAAVFNNVGNDLGTEVSPEHKQVYATLDFVGALCGCLTGAAAAHRLGKRRAIYVGIGFSTIGIIIQCTSNSIGQSLAGKFIAGLSTGVVSTVIPMYIAELAPADKRGAMLGLWTMVVTTSQLIAYGIGTGLRAVDNGWRAIVAIGATFNVLLAVLLPLVPQSPHEIVSREDGPDAAERATKIWERLNPRASRAQARAEIETLVREKRERACGTLRDKLKRLTATRQERRKLLVACLLMLFSQVTGFNSLMCYAPTLLAHAGVKNPEKLSLPIIACNVVFTAIYVPMVDRIGKRRMMLSSQASSQPSPGTPSPPPPPPFPSPPFTSSPLATTLILTSALLFVASYASALGNAPWASTEFFPADLRPFGAMLLTMSNWTANILVSATFLTTFRSLGGTRTYVIYGALGLACWLFVAAAVPETKGMALEEVATVFEDERWAGPVRKARAWQRSHGHGHVHSRPAGAGAGAAAAAAASPPARDLHV
ncbi:myo-inositol transporter [Drepanopeziza brunnea f. sp. 'multigermtubi' MB_m1]|uniref:Myo-inositol transporter n=1 Tax=Marssonina brunnea f. sp. multigermtubi (strain MB_m1) TaxID=1072389 RepID=K1WJE9_MARBU|nr:myo-inositol transporter [Drepanopeziza brunnea f. sp. 'multigermtubi' MB_m1]EKD12342.1 myo-inositol transporter [Drepanopeziza brunnea f. sp. 'multigermtubi' MB_m1]